MSKPSSIFVANSVPVLNFSRLPDRQNMIVPPECYCDLQQPTVWVYFESEDRAAPVGKATLWRQGDTLMADLKLVSSWLPIERAQEAISKLWPSTAFYVKDAYENVVTYLRVHSITLSQHPGADPTLLPLGNRLVLESGKDTGH